MLPWANIVRTDVVRGSVVSKYAFRTNLVRANVRTNIVKNVVGTNIVKKCC